MSNQSNTKLATIEFHGHSIITTLIDGKPYVALRPICQRLGLDWEAQRQRIERHPVLSTCAVVIQAQLAGDTQRRQVTFLPIEYLHGWLFGVESSRLAPEPREVLVAYQRESFAVLDTYWRRPEQPSVRPGQAENLRREREEADSLPPPEMVLLLKSNLKVKDQVITSLKDELLQSLRFQVHTLSRPKRHRPRARPLSKEEIGQIHALHAQGFSVGGIGRRLARSHATVSFVLRGAGVGAQAAAGVAS